MAATEPSRALRALTSAALVLPGVQVQAALPAAQPEFNTQYGFYQENDRRMRVEIYHGDFVMPVNDRVEFTFNLARDTYSGATPAFSLPQTLANQLKYQQNADGLPAAQLSLVDVVSAASQGVTAGGLTLLGGLNAFKDFVDARAAAESRFIADNPRPPSPPSVPSIPGPATIDFQQMTFASYSGAGNVAALAGGNCPGNAALGCYYEDGIAVGVAADSSNPVAHLHRTGAAANRQLNYHADSAGIYLRALDGAAFNLASLDFLAPLATVNPDTGPNDVWEILGFNSAENPNLDVGDGTNYPARVAYQTVPNGFNGSLALGPGFQNVNALWIHYKGYPQTPADGKDFDLRLDNVRLDQVTVTTAQTPAQDAWAAQLEREVAIAQYRAVLDKVMPVGDPPAQRLQQQPRESRTQPVMGAKVFWDETTLAVSGGFSDEPDFNSNFGSFNLSREFNAKQTTLSFGYGYTHNAITREDGSRQDHGHAEHADDAPDAPDYPELDEESDYHNLNTSLAEVLSKNQLLQVSASYTHQHGYLSNPYKLVYVRGEITAEEYYNLWQAEPGEIDWQAVTPLEVAGIELFRERRPDRRRQWSVATRFNQHVPALNASVHLDYRFYADDWEIKSHTFGIAWYQELPYGFTLAPFLRYYTQSRAAFFAPYFLAPRADGHYSSDFRLAGFGAVSGGLSITREIGDAMRIQAGVETYTHEGGLKLGGGSSGDYADFNHYLVHASLNVDLSAARFSGVSRQDAAHHALAPFPAGVLFGHRLAQAGDFMVGYRYMDMRQDGAMQRGSDGANDEVVREVACGIEVCRTRPVEMTMRMHMLELMFAPTDWLTLMVMPQILDTEMTLAQIPRAPAAQDHLGEHTSDGLGDTSVAALFRVFDRAGHHLHLSFAISAPTGEPAATMDGLATASTLLHDYGMQRGSGTWDARPALTYVGEQQQWFWGAQVSGIKRLEDRNDAGYAFGDGWQASGWGGHRLTRWLSATIRGLYTEQGDVRGAYIARHSTEAPVDHPANYGGRFLDIGAGISAAAPGGNFAGHTFSVEWVQPLADDFNGIQLERDGALTASWSYGF